MANKDAAPVDGRPDTEVPRGIQRDQYGRPIIDGRPYTRASTFGACLEDTFGVTRWKLGMVAFGLGKREDLRLRAAGVSDPCGAADGGHRCKPPCVDSPEGKRELREVQEAAVSVSGADRKASLGTALHALTEQIDHGVELASQGRFDPILARYRELIAPFAVRCTEVFTRCDRWGTAGTFDSLVSPRGFLTAPDGEVFGPADALVVDKKTSGTARYFGAKFTVQTKTYSAGEMVDKQTGEPIGWADHPRPSQTWALILHLPSNPESIDDAGWHWVDLTAGERLCDLAAAVRRVQWEKNLIVPMCREVSAVHPHDVRRAGAAAQIAGARSVAALRMVHRSHRELWDDELQAAAVARKAQLEGELAGVSS
jgi:hypothetical protein